MATRPNEGFRRMLSRIALSMRVSLFIESELFQSSLFWNTSAASSWMASKYPNSGGELRISSKAVAEVFMLV